MKHTSPMNHRELCLVTQTEIDAVKWMLSNGYLKSECFCNKCNGHQMALTFDINTARFQCRRCKSCNSIYTGTILYNSNITLRQFLDLAYCWSGDMLQTKARFESRVESKSTSTKYYTKLGYLAAHIIKNDVQAKIGEPGKIVEVDESKFTKRKYNVGRAVRSPWVIGGIDLETRKVFFVEVFSGPQKL
jgi:hypothetical protein